MRKTFQRVLLVSLAVAFCGCTMGDPKKDAGKASAAGEPTKNTEQATAAETAPPPHRLCDIDQLANGASVSVFAVVDPHLSPSDAWVIFHYYEKRYPDARLALNVDLFCDDTYANHRFLSDSSVSDRTYYSHVIYSFMKNVDGVTISTPQSPTIAGQGSACR